jgi:quercetin dioxygenase-like cupin family protein/DNA-binding transcriptional regulator YiaG
MLISSTLLNLETLRFWQVTASFRRINCRAQGLFATDDAVLEIHSNNRREEDTVTTLEAAVDSQSERIGGRIRELRRARGLTLVQLAAAANLSHPFLSQLERGRARPSMISLEKIARALGSSQLELIASAEDDADPHQSPTVLVRAGEGTRGPYGEGNARLLVHGKRRFHPMEFTAANLIAGDYYVHEEDEFIHVVAGRVEVDLQGHEVQVLSEGDSLYYVGGTPHRWRAIDPAGYRLFVVKEKPEVL